MTVNDGVGYPWSLESGLVITGYVVPHALGWDLMRERTRSRIQDGGRQRRSGNTVLFLLFWHWFSTRNLCPGKFVFRVNTCYIKFDGICPLLLLGSVWKLTQDARTNMIYDALTYIASKQRMRERTLRCANERFPVATNEHRLLASLRYHLWIIIEICFSLRIVLDENNFITLRPW